MTEKEKILANEFKQLGFNYEKMLPKMYVSEKSFVLMDHKDIKNKGEKKDEIIFTFIITTPKERPPYIAMLKANIRRSTPEDAYGTNIFKKEYWFYQGKLPTRKKVIDEMYKFLKTEEVANRFNVSKNSAEIQQEKDQNNTIRRRK